MTFHLSERAWLFYGLFLATLVFLSLGSAGLGVGGSFNAWGLFLEAIKGVIFFEILTVILAFIASLLTLLGPLLVALLGAYVFHRLSKQIGGIEWLKELITLPNVLMFLLFLVLLL